MALFTALFGTLAATTATTAAAATATTAAAAAIPAATVGASAATITAGATEATALAATEATAAAGTAEASLGVTEVVNSAGAIAPEMGTATTAAEAGVSSTTAPTVTGGSEIATDKVGVESGTIFTKENAFKAASAAVSQGMQYKNQKAAEAAAADAQQATGKIASLRARNARLDALSQARISIGNREASAGAVGLGAQTSGLRGGVAGTQTALAKEWGDSRSLEGLAAKAGSALQSASDFGNAAAGWQMASNMVNKTIAPTIFQTTNNPNANLGTNIIDWLNS